MPTDDSGACNELKMSDVRVRTTSVFCRTFQMGVGGAQCGTVRGMQIGGEVGAEPMRAVRRVMGKLSSVERKGSTASSVMPRHDLLVALGMLAGACAGVVLCVPGSFVMAFVDVHARKVEDQKLTFDAIIDCQRYKETIGKERLRLGNLGVTPEAREDLDSAYLSKAEEILEKLHTVTVALKELVPQSVMSVELTEALLAPRCQDSPIGQMNQQYHRLLQLSEYMGDKRCFGRATHAALVRALTNRGPMCALHDEQHRGVKSPAP